MRRTFTSTRALGTGLILALAIMTNAISASGREALPADVGMGWKSGLACAACAAGGLTLAAAGPAAILAAAFFPGSTVIVVGCALTCYDAFTE